MKLAGFFAAAALAAGLAAPAQAGANLDAIRAADVLKCGVNTGSPGYSAPDSKGVWTGLDIDMCKAVAAAIFGDATKTKYVPLTAQQRFTALQSGEIDLLSRQVTITLLRDTTLGLNYAGVNFYDGQGFLVHKRLGISSAKELNGATVCVAPGTTTELNLADYFRANKMEMRPVVIEALDELRKAFFSGRCDAYTTDSSALASTRATVSGNPEDYVLLPERISKEPLGPMVRQGDDQFLDIVKWSLNAMIEAEEYGITQKNVDEKLKSEDPVVKRILGTAPGMGKALGVDDKWAYNIVKQVGNYGESYDRNLGEGSPIKLARGINELWTKGGLMYALPIR